MIIRSSIILIITLFLTSCGKIGALEMTQEDRRPDFDNVIFEK